MMSSPSQQSVHKTSLRAHIDEDEHLITTCVVRIKSKELLAQVLALHEQDDTCTSVSSDYSRQSVSEEDLGSILRQIREIFDYLKNYEGDEIQYQPNEYMANYVAITMSEILHKLLQNKQIVHAALDVMYRILTAKILGDMEDTEYITDFECSVTTSVRAGLMRWGYSWLEESDNAGVFAGKMCIGLDRISQVNLDTFLETAKQIMESTELVDAPKVHRCAVLVNQFTVLHVMPKKQCTNYLKLVSTFALWLVHNFNTREPATLFVGIVGCELLYNMCNIHMPNRHVEDLDLYRQAAKWFRDRSIPGILMAFKGYRPDSDRMIQEISDRVAADTTLVLGKRDRESGPECASEGEAGPAKRGQGGSA